MTHFNLSILLTLLSISLFAQIDSAIYDIEQHRKKQEAEFRDPKESPLDKKLRKHFKGLNYYPIDLAYRVKATFVKTENPVLFQMKTTTSRLPEYQKYGEVHFKLDGEDRMLEVYQNERFPNGLGWRITFLSLLPMRPMGSIPMKSDDTWTSAFQNPAMSRSILTNVTILIAVMAQAIHVPYLLP